VGRYGCPAAKNPNDSTTETLPDEDRADVTPEDEEPGKRVPVNEIALIGLSPSR